MILVDANLHIYAVDRDSPHLEHGCSIVSADNDFRRFAAVTHLNPLAA